MKKLIVIGALVCAGCVEEPKIDFKKVETRVQQLEEQWVIYEVNTKSYFRPVFSTFLMCSKERDDTNQIVHDHILENPSNEVYICVNLTK